MNEPLARMLLYDRWATETLLTACRDLSAEVLQSRPPGVSGTIGELPTHIAGSQETFALRTKGRQHEGEVTRESAWPGIDALQPAISTRACDELIDVAASMDEEAQVDLPFMDKVYRFPKSFFLAHALEHGVEHRTEVKVALNQLGVETPDLDGWAFAAAQGYGREV